MERQPVHLWILFRPRVLSFRTSSHSMTLPMFTMPTRPPCSTACLPIAHLHLPVVQLRHAELVVPEIGSLDCFQIGLSGRIRDLRLVFDTATVRGGRSDKTRTTLLFCVNATG